MLAVLTGTEACRLRASLGRHARRLADLERMLVGLGERARAAPSMRAAPATRRAAPTGQGAPASPAHASESQADRSTPLRLAARVPGAWSPVSATCRARFTMLGATRTGFLTGFSAPPAHGASDLPPRRTNLGTRGIRGRESGLRNLSRLTRSPGYLVAGQWRPRSRTRDQRPWRHCCCAPMCMPVPKSRICYSRGVRRAEGRRPCEEWPWRCYWQPAPGLCTTWSGCRCPWRWDSRPAARYLGCLWRRPQRLLRLRPQPWYPPHLHRRPRRLPRLHQQPQRLPLL
jgi:hypothetical protein